MARIYPVTADQGAAFKLSLNFEEVEGIPTDLSSGWAARFVLKESLDASGDIIDVTDADAQVTLSDGTGGVNLLVFIGKTITTAWVPMIGAKYELQLWPTAAPEDITVLLKGDMEIRRGLL